MSDGMNGQEIISMWKADRPDPENEITRGFKTLDSARHVLIFNPTRQIGAYSHHPRIVRHAGFFHIIWSNHRDGEDAPGQRVLYCCSADAANWSVPIELFAAPGEERKFRATGYAHTAVGFLVRQGRLFALAMLHETISQDDYQRKYGCPAVANFDDDPTVRHGLGYMAREIRADDLGGVFPLMDRKAVPDDLAYRCEQPDPVAEELNAMLAQPEYLMPWDYYVLSRIPEACDGHHLIEPAVFKNSDAQWVRLLRDTMNSHRLYVSVYDDQNRAWSPGRPSDIPDSTSLCATLTLDNGTVLLLGNQIAPEMDNPEEVGHYLRFPLTVAVSPDGKTFDRAYCLRYGPHPWSVPHWTGEPIGGRAPGYQYPHAVVHDHELHAVYSVGKERIELSTVSLAALGL